MGKKKGKKNASVVAEVIDKAKLNNLMASFQRNKNSSVLEFPDLNGKEKDYVFTVAAKYELKLEFEEPNNGNRKWIATRINQFRLDLQDQALEILHHLGQQPLEQLSHHSSHLPSERNQGETGQNSSPLPVIPPSVQRTKFEHHQLPAWQHKDKIVDVVSNNQVVIITGETGSGKTTQIPQFFLERLADMKQPAGIICTQPRRIAAKSVADRVAWERDEEIGRTVGYRVRHDAQVSPSTALVFCTTGILLRQLTLVDDFLAGVTHLFMDEAHERTCEGDFLLCIVREKLRRHPNLKVVLMSAAMATNVFQNFFETCPLLSIEGRSYPVTQFFLEDVLVKTKFLGVNNVPPSELLKMFGRRYGDVNICYGLIVSLLLYIDDLELAKSGESTSNGAVLVFLPGVEEINAVDQKIAGAASNRFEVLKLHSNMQRSLQDRVFLPSQSGKRKVVLSTNVAETSITIDDVVFVIDGGKAKVKSFDASSGTSSLTTEWISQASAIQRKGRAGRCRPGMCFHLFSSERYQLMQKYQLPAIWRVPLEELCLQSKTLAPNDMRIVEFISRVPEPPSIASIEQAVKNLELIGTLDSSENLTCLGRLLLKLSLEPYLGKMLITSALLRCVDPVLTIVSCLSSPDPFISPADPEGKKALIALKSKLALGTKCDLMIYLRLFNLYLVAQSGGDDAIKAFADKFSVSIPRMEAIALTRNQLSGQIHALFNGIPNHNKNSWVAVKASVVSGLYPQIARVRQPTGKTETSTGIVRLSKKSVLLASDDSESKKTPEQMCLELPCKWIVFKECFRLENGPPQLNYNTLVTPLTLALMCGGNHSRNIQKTASESFEPGASPLVRNLPAVSATSNFSAVAGCSSVPSSAVIASNSHPSAGSSSTIEISNATEGRVPMKRSQSIVGVGPSSLDASNNSSPQPAKKKKSNQTMLFVDDWIQLQVESAALNGLLVLRRNLLAMFSRRMSNPAGTVTELDEEVLNTLLEVLQIEEAATGLPVSPDFLSGTDN